MPSSAEPQLHSLALDAIPQPDFADVQIVRLPPGADPDPRVWAGRVFDPANAPAWVAGLMGVRQAVVGVVVDLEANLLRVTTTVTLEGWRGRLYFARCQSCTGRCSVPCWSAPNAATPDPGRPQSSGCRDCSTEGRYSAMVGWIGSASRRVG